MLLLSLTGGIGMGKSTSAQLLLSRSIPVVDTDDLARQVVEPGQPALAEIRDHFGPEIIALDGHLLRDELARRVFSDPTARQQLEAILHPRIRALWQTQIAAWKSQPTPPDVAAVVIPLLFETNAQSDFDATLCIACSPATQQKRLATRGWTSEQIDQRIRAQLPIEQKMSKADYVIWTEGDIEIHSAQLDRVLKNAVETANLR